MPLTGSRPPARSDFANRTVEIPDDRNSEDRSRWFVYGLATCADEDRRENQTGVLPRSCRPAPEIPNPSFWYRLSLGAPDLSCGPRVNQSSNRELSIDSNRFMSLAGGRLTGSSETCPQQFVDRIPARARLNARFFPFGELAAPCSYPSGKKERAAWVPSGEM